MLRHGRPWGSVSWPDIGPPFTHFVRQHFRPLIDHGLIALAAPMKATDPRATYLLTEAGMRLLHALPERPPNAEAD